MKIPFKKVPFFLPVLCLSTSIAFATNENHRIPECDLKPKHHHDHHSHNNNHSHHSDHNQNQGSAHSNGPATSAGVNSVPSQQQGGHSYSGGPNGDGSGHSHNAGGHSHHDEGGQCSNNNPPSNPDNPPSNPGNPPSNPGNPPSNPGNPPSNPGNPPSNPGNPGTHGSHHSAGGGSNNDNGDKRDSSHFKVTVFPIPYFNYDQGRKIINLGSAFEHPAGKAAVDSKSWATAAGELEQQQNQQQQNQQQTPAPTLYKVIDNSSTVFGLGVGINAGFNISESVGQLAGIVGAVLPMYGKTMHAERFAFTHEQAKNLAAPWIPKDADEILSWTVGDSINYATKGAVTLMAGFQFAAHGALVPIQIEGTWGVSFQRVSESHVLYSIERITDGNIKLLLGNPIAKLSLEHFHDLKKVYTYELDLNSEEVRETFKKLVRGNLKNAQELASNPGSGVNLIKDLRAYSRGTGFGVNLGLPVVIRLALTKKFSSSRVQEFNYIDNVAHNYFEYTIDRHHLFSHIRNIFKKENKHTKFRHMNKHLISMGRVSPTIQNNDVYGELSWSYTNDVAKPRYVDKAVQSLQKFSGLSDAMVQIPIPRDQELIGYVGITYTLPISHALLQSVYTSSIAKDQSFAMNVMENEIVNYFHVEGDPAKLCIQKSGRMSKTCVKYQTSKARSAMKKVTSLAKRYFERENNDQEKAKIIAHLGYSIARSPLAIRSLLKSAGRKVEATFRAEGELFTPIVRIVNRSVNN